MEIRLLVLSVGLLAETWGGSRRSMIYRRFSRLWKYRIREST